MAEEGGRIDWSGVVTNAVSTLVAAVFVGAAIIVWNAATTIDVRIEAATSDIKENQGSLLGTQRDLRASQVTLTEEIAALRAEVKRLKGQLAGPAPAAPEREPAGGQPAAADPVLQEFKEQDVQRIQQEYERNRFAIEQQAIRKE